MDYIYLLESYTEFETTYKIGFSKRVEFRLQQLQTGNSSQLSILSQFPTKFGRKVESTLHQFYKHKNICGEWFNLSEEEVKNFLTICKQIEENFLLLMEQNSYFSSNIMKKTKRKNS